MTEWWVTTLWQVSPALLMSWVIWVIGSITLHELAHGWQAIRCGDRTPIESGHMTWNPVVHMGPTSLIMFALLGFAWGAMPVNPSRFRRSTDDALVAFAGPVMNFSLAVIAIVGGAVWVAMTNDVFWGALSVSETVADNVAMFFLAGSVLNIVLMVLNLIPIPPLDGWRIVSTFWPRYGRMWESPQGQFVALFAFVAVFFWGSSRVFAVGIDITHHAQAWVLRMIV